MRIQDILTDTEDIRSLAQGKNSHIRLVLYKALDTMINSETEKMLKSPGISDSEFKKDIRTNIGRIEGLKLVKNLLEIADEHYGR